MLTDCETGEQLATDGRYILSPKDLCTIDFLDKFIEAGVGVLKIEGRARGAEYVKRVVEAYDKALRDIESGNYSRESVEELKPSLEKVFNRGFWGGYYAGAPVAEHTNSYGSSATRRKEYVGKVTNYFKRLGVAEVLIEASTLEVGDEVLWLGDKTGVVEQTVGEIRLDEQPAQAVKQGDLCSIKVEGGEIRRGDKLYKEVAREVKR